MSIRAEAYHNGSQEAMKLYQMVKNDPAYDTSNREEALLMTADYLLRKKKVKDAAGILKFVLKEFPASGKAKARLQELEDYL